MKQAGRLLFTQMNHYTLCFLMAGQAGRGYL